MSLSKDEIIELARRYIGQEEIGDFPQQGDLFFFIERVVSDTTARQAEHEGWKFGGYGLCTGYEFDLSSKPEGKWLMFNFISLQTFPPTKQGLKLQPPHIVKGTYHNQERSREIKILRIAGTMFVTEKAIDALSPVDAENQGSEMDPPDNIIQFPGGRSWPLQ